MSNLAELKGRMAEAVGRLSDAQAMRGQSNEALAHLLGDLEDKYRARNEELTYCARRINSLAAENRELRELAERLLGIVEGAFARGTDDPVYQASAMASELLAGWSEDTSAVAGTAGPHTGPGAGPDAAPAGRFEDVTEAELAAELADELIEGAAAGELPPPLIEASAAHHAMSFPDGFAAPELPVPIDDDILIVEDDPQMRGDEPVEDLVILVDERADNAGAADPQGAAGERALDSALGLGEGDLAAPSGPGVDIEIPEIHMADGAATGAGAGPVEDRDPEASIRAMMERLEQAEGRARAHVREQRGAGSS